LANLSLKMLNINSTVVQKIYKFRIRIIFQKQKLMLVNFSKGMGSGDD